MEDTMVIPPSLKVLFEKLISKEWSVIQENDEERWNNELPKFIRMWERKLAEMEPLVKVAEEHQFERKDAKMWLNDLQDWFYDAEDILDEFATDLRLKELHHQQPQQQQPEQQQDDYDDDDDDDSSSTSTYFTCHDEDLPSDADDILDEFDEQDDSPATSSCFPINQVNKIEVLNKRLEDIQNGATWFKYLPQSLSREELQIRRPKTSSIPSNDVLGRDYVRRQIINLLLTEEPNDDRNYIVIVIVGQGGIGKTTLAQSVYNDDSDVKPHFDIKAWVCVSEVFDIHQITTTIINAISGHNPSKFSDLNKAQEKLQEILFRKRFLIVLDDVWSENYELWNQLQAPFRKGFKGSKVIVTTRMKRVARTMKIETTQSHFIFLKGLSDDACWSICKQHAGISDEPFDEMRNQITELSKGLPLAAKALGGLLRQNDKLHWSTILRRNSWKKQSGIIMPALRLSYYHLPHHLKRVFAYCSVFPKDHRMVKNDVVLMWMAEGFLPDSKEESMESKGHSYFDDLVSRSLFEPTSHNGKGYFIMHDLIHDLAQWVAGYVCCRLQRNDDDNVKDITRFLSVAGEIGLAQFMKDKAGKKLRTFAILQMPYNFKQVDALNFHKFQCIRVLCIDRMGFEVLPSSIGNLKHLRLLDLSRNKLKELPESMRTLCNLQTLILKKNKHLPKVLSMRPFVELRHLDIEECPLLVEMPSGFKELRKMRTSRRFIISANSGPRISDLENLKYLSGSLDIFGLENVTNSEDAQRARMNEKLDLKILRIFWGTLTLSKKGLFGDILPDPIVRRKHVELTVELEVLNQLKPPKSIKEVELDGYMGIAFPDWLGSPTFNNMVVIKLKDCSKCERLPSFGQLPYLKKLEIRSCPLLLQVDTSSFPPNLKILHIFNCPKLKVNLPSFPLLEELVLKGCRELNSIDEPVISCSRSIVLSEISSFSGVEGFWVPDIVKLVVMLEGRFTLEERVTKHGNIYMEKCPELLSWRPENLYGESTKLTHVTLGNCKAWTSFLESNFPSSLRRLIIYEDNIIKDISKFTQQSTCLLRTTAYSL